MDFSVPPDLEGMVEIFQTNREWDAVFAYGIDSQEVYWDWYAFRDRDDRIGSELLGNYWWYMPRPFRLSYSDDWHPVYSAFGGCAIYKKSSIAGCRYSAIVTKDLETLSRRLIEEGRQIDHPQVLRYLDGIQNLSSIVTIKYPDTGLPSITDPDTGIHCAELGDSLIWRMSSFVYQYPSVCEHVTFHASMIARGHDKLFIHPRLIFRYGIPEQWSLKLPKNR
jgi:hypothetical protein